MSEILLKVSLWTLHIYIIHICFIVEDLQNSWGIQRLMKIHPYFSFKFATKIRAFSNRLFLYPCIQNMMTTEFSKTRLVDLYCSKLPDKYLTVLSLFTFIVASFLVERSKYIGTQRGEEIRSKMKQMPFWIHHRGRWL